LNLASEDLEIGHLTTFTMMVANNVRSKPSHRGSWDLAPANLHRDDDWWCPIVLRASNVVEMSHYVGSRRLSHCGKS